MEPKQFDTKNVILLVVQRMDADQVDFHYEFLITNLAANPLELKGPKW